VVPVAATVKVAVCPAVTVSPAGCVVIMGDCESVDGGGAWYPVPLKATETPDPLERVNVKVPVYDCAPDGVKVTEPVRLCPGLRIIGRIGPEKENCAADSKVLTVFIFLELEFVTVMVTGVLVEPTAWFGKLTVLGPTVTLACTGLIHPPKARRQSPR
jgi:hypothetical protein